MAWTQDRARNFAFFVLGIAVPVAAFVAWTKRNDGVFWCGRKRQIDKAHDVTVEDSFPASDPPSAW